MQTLDIISINLWQMLVSLANLTLLFFIVKFFLYKPVKKMLKTRQETIDGEYNAANEAKMQALNNKNEYEEKLSGAKHEADAIIKKAVDIAAERENEIVEEAKQKADSIIRQAQNDAILEKKKAEDEMKKEIVEVSSLLTEKMLEREFSVNDHKKLIDSFIESIGDENGST